MFKPGFIDESYNGFPIFIRYDYEKAHNKKSEHKRLSEYLDLVGASYGALISKARNKDIRLTYKKYSQFDDDEIERKYGANKEQWIPYKNGYLNRVTFEYSPYKIPDYQSLPCWCLNQNKYRHSIGEDEGKSLVELLLYLLTIIFTK